MKARNLIHARIEENIRAKIRRLGVEEPQGDCKDALQLLIEHSWERGERLDMQVNSNCKRWQACVGCLWPSRTLPGGGVCVCSKVLSRAQLLRWAPYPDSTTGS